jgi:hypothetical protein
MPPPAGIFGIPRRRLIDVDEVGFLLQRANRKYGHAYSGVRVRKPGNYGRDVNITVFLAVGFQAMHKGVWRDRVVGPGYL